MEKIKSSSSQIFQDLGYPKTNLENWKYTSSKFFQNYSFQKNKIHFPQEINRQNNTIYFINGVLDDTSWENFSLKKNISLEKIDSHVHESTILSSQNFIKESMFHLSLSGVQDANYWRIISNNPLEINIVYIFDTSIENNMIASLNVFSIGDNTEIKINEKKISLNSSCLGISLSNFFCSENSNLSHSLVTNDNNLDKSLSFYNYKMQKNSNLAIDNVNHSSNFDKKFFEIDLDGEGSDAEVNILNLVKGTQHYDNNILVNHNAPNCSSRQKVNNILDNQSTAVFNGKVIVLKNAQKTDSEQSNKNLLLSKQSKAHSNPQLEIFADDVKCGHGSTTGALDNSSIFYLRSRGLSEEESRKILIEAFAKEIVEDFNNSDLESDCNIIISKWING